MSKIPTLVATGAGDDGKRKLMAEDFRLYATDLAAYLLENEGRFVAKDDLGGLQVRMGEIEQLIKDSLSGVPDDSKRGAEVQLRALLDTLTGDPEFKHVSREYRNLICLTPEELVGLPTRSWNISPEVRAAVLSQPEAVALRDLTRLHELNDTLLYIDEVFSQRKAWGRIPREERIKTLKPWAEYDRLAQKYGRAFVTSSGGGANLIPTLLSGMVAQKVELALLVDSIFPSITMDGPTFDWPVITSHITYYSVAENTSDTWADPATYSTPGINKPQWVAKKLMGFCVISGEATEDTIIATVPFITQRFVDGAAHAIDNVDVNGDTDASMDGTTFNPAGSQLRSWNGLRQIVFETGSYPAKIDYAGNDLALKSIALQKAMGVWGVPPSGFVWIAGLTAYHKMREHSAYRTMEVAGGRAATMTGQVGWWEGSPVVLSDKVEDQKTTGVYGDGTSRTLGTLIGVRADRFVRGIRRELDIETSTEHRFTMDQIVMRGRLRRAFNTLDTPAATVTPVGAVYNI